MKLNKKELKKFKEYFINSFIYFEYNHRKIDEKAVYVESRDGNDFTGNILRIVEELSTGDYGDYKIYVFAKKNVHDKIKQLQKNYNLKIHRITSKESIATVFLERAKYIITDSGMRPKFVKREGQIFLNTWHGTPLKYMGIKNHPEEHRTGNIQTPFMATDYLLYPNEYMKEKMLEAYMIEKIYPGTLLLEGYPRNSVFFDEKRRDEMKSVLDFKDKEIFVYMPTFKGVLFDRNDEEQKDETIEFLNEIDEKLTDNQVLLVKLHVYNHSKINFAKFKHVKAFPTDYEAYDVLNVADCLITDYSSVFFDFANTRRKIILFNYDEEEYMDYRGTYFPLDDLPFPKVQTVEDLVNELNSPKEYDDDEFIEKFCTYDRENAAKYICKHVFTDEKICKEEKIVNDKPNVLIFAGGLLNNGLTASLLSLLYNIDRKKYNIFISFRQWDSYVKENHRLIFEKMPDDVEFYPLRSEKNPTILEILRYKKFKNAKEGTELPEPLIKFFKREFQRYYPNSPFDHIINFDGYGKDEILLFTHIDIKNSIWVHNDMLQEIKTRNNQNFNILKYAYCNYDNTIIVSPDLKEPTSKISGRTDNIRLVHNINNYDKIKENALKDIYIDKNTMIVTSNHHGIEGVLESKGKKIITIGRYSPEKAHERLLTAFDELCDDYPDTQLIIIGGHGKLYNNTIKWRENLKHWENVTLIKWISNPMPILNRCDLFILPSLYEGWPMVLMEADTLDIPVVATDTVGTQWMKDYGGYLAENSYEGVLQGLYDFMEGKVNRLNIDYEEYNKQAAEEFYSIIDE